MVAAGSDGGRKRASEKVAIVQKNLDKLATHVWVLDARVDPGAAEAYVRACAHLFAIELHVPATEFYNRLDSINFGNAVFGRCHGVAQRFERTQAHILADPSDTVLIVVDLAEARWHGDYHGRLVSSGAGGIRIVDMARPYWFDTEAFETLSLMLPRAALGAAGALDLHGLALSEQESTGRMLGSHLRAIWESRDQMTRAHAEAAMSAAATLVAGAVAEHAGDSAGEHRPGHKALLASARALIERRLSDPDLSPDQLRAELGISRSLLYQVFEPLGGVGKFIQTCRLDHAFDAILRADSDGKTLSEIGFSHGFRSDAHFSRLFRSRFSIPPGQLRRLRSQAAAKRSSAVDRPGDVWMWLSHL